MMWKWVVLVIAVLAIAAGAALIPFAHDFGDWQLIGPLILIPAGLLLLIALGIVLFIIHGYPKRIWRYIWATKSRLQ